MWTMIKIGSRVEVRNVSTDETIAVVGNDNDPRLMKRTADAMIIAQAPQMLDALLDVQDLIKREFMDTSHPLAELVTSKINSIVSKSFLPRERYVPRQDRSFRSETDSDSYQRPHLVSEQNVASDFAAGNQEHLRETS